MRSPLPRHLAFIMGAIVAAGLPGCGGSTPTDTESASTTGAVSSATAEQAGTTAPTSGAHIVGIAFVDSSVTGQGSRATLPAGATVRPIGSTITGTEGCSTTRYGTDGLIVAVIDYTGRPTAASLTITENRAGGSRVRAPYYLDLDTGRTLQFLGPVVENGTYDLALEYDLAQGAPRTTAGQFALARACVPAR